MEEDEGLREIHQVLHGYFENDTRQRFQLEGPIASGADSIAWRVQQSTCGQKGSQACQRIVLKTPKWADLDELGEETPADDVNPCNNGSNSLDPIENEKKWLKVLQWAKHVMNILEVPADPLNRRRSPLRRHGVDNWIFIEWIQHGTLRRLVRRARTENTDYLPNRMLWRFFMCPMAWPPEQPIGPPDGAFEITRQTPPLKITHGDLHSENVMIGPFEPDSEYPEHDITPVLKMIDLGKMSGNDSCMNSAPFSTPGSVTTSTTGGRRPSSNPRRPRTQHPLHPKLWACCYRTLSETTKAIFPAPRLDPDLRLLVCRCLAVRSGSRPGLAELFEAVMEAIRVRDAAWYASEGAGYCNPARETDESISGLLQLLLRDAGSG
ncbi:kinase-like domain-containing protein [Apiospora aurea]|uniref:Kinase-like domain-containing protein n=1 Tax=Apiospora aurea TaxID=335848 RepID=A0ABR1PRT5_9PEZI